MTRERIQISPAIVDRLRRRLVMLYGDERAAECCSRLVALLQHYAQLLPVSSRAGGDHREIVLITYGDQVSQPGEAPLRTLREFLVEQGLEPLLRIVHILPFYPYSSDDGFSVIDYRAVDPALGDWEDVRQLGQRFELMFDLVLNHVSRQSDWFTAYQAGRAPYDGYFLEADPEADLSQVTRPRSLPLLTEVDTNRGRRHVWTTFSSDQIDLNFANPAVLLEMIEILLEYLRHGARVIRLDAVAYLWKEPGTTCIHLPQTHEVVKLLRDVVDVLAPQVRLITETNVPHAENVGYFGAGDEAHLVYQFSLPPLLLDASLQGDATPLLDWMKQLAPARPGTSFFNFTASHDGIGVRPLEGLVTEERFARLVEAIPARGGLVSTRRRPDGRDVPYELNISFVSALGEPAGLSPALHARRFLTSQGLMLALQGLPAVYFHSLVGTENDLQGAATSGQPRRINRRKFRLAELQARLSDADSLAARIFRGYRDLLTVRIEQPAFHPEGPQAVLDLQDPSLVSVLRTSPDGRQRILVLANLGSQNRALVLSAHTDLRFSHDLLSGHNLGPDQRFGLGPYQLAWLAAK